MRRAFTFLQSLMLVAAVMFCAVLIYPMFARVSSRPNEGRIVCLSNLKQIGLGFAQYTQDYTKFPPTGTASTVGWANALFPYVKTESIFQCDKTRPDPTGSFTTDYFYNRRLSRLGVGKISTPTSVILSGDAEDNAPTWNFWVALPSDVLTNYSSPSRRHQGAAMYLFADGHVKWIAPEKISSTQKPALSSATFAVR